MGKKIIKRIAFEVMMFVILVVGWFFVQHFLMYIMKTKVEFAGTWVSARTGQIIFSAPAPSTYARWMSYLSGSLFLILPYLVYLNIKCIRWVLRILRKKRLKCS